MDVEDIYLRMWVHGGHGKFRKALAKKAADLQKKLQITPEEMRTAKSRAAKRVEAKKFEEDDDGRWLTGTVSGGQRHLGVPLPAALMRKGEAFREYASTHRIFNKDDQGAPAPSNPPPSPPAPLPYLDGPATVNTTHR